MEYILEHYIMLSIIELDLYKEYNHIHLKLYFLHDQDLQLCRIPICALSVTVFS